MAKNVLTLKTEVLIKKWIEHAHNKCTIVKDSSDIGACSHCIEFNVINTLTWLCEEGMIEITGSPKNANLPGQKRI